MYPIGISMSWLRLCPEPIGMGRCFLSVWHSRPSTPFFIVPLPVSSCPISINLFFSSLLKVHRSRVAKNFCGYWLTGMNSETSISDETLPHKVMHIVISKCAYPVCHTPRAGIRQVAPDPTHVLSGPSQRPLRYIPRGWRGSPAAVRKGKGTGRLDACQPPLPQAFGYPLRPGQPG